MILTGAADCAEAGMEGEVEGRAGNYALVDKTRTAFKQDHRSRKLKQIFVRGSNIVLVSRDPHQQEAEPGPEAP